MKKKPTETPSKVQRRTLTDIVNALRDAGRRFDLAAIVKAAKEQDVTVGWQELRKLVESSQRGAISITPRFITEFMAGLAAELRPKSVLDPNAGVGSTLIPVVSGTGIPSATGISRSASDIEIARLMGGHTPINWILAPTSTGLQSLGEYDLIISCPPLGLLSQMITIDNAGNRTIETLDSGTTALLASSQHLSTSGVGVFLLSNGFPFEQSEASVRDALPKAGLHINSVVSLPAGTFTGVPLNIVVLSRTKTPDLFVGQLTPDADHRPLLSNLLKRRAGASLALGRLVRADEFKSFQTLQARDEEERLAQRTGLKAVPLREVVEAVNLGKQTDDGGFENLPNCVYVPLIGTGPAVASLSDLQIKPQNYAQLEVKPEVAHAEFLAGLFNSPLGRKVREGMLSGTIIPKLSKQTITPGTVYLAPIQLQQDAMAASRELHDLRLQLEQLERDLWNRPVEVAKVRKAITTVNQKDGFESWLETLPFPLASILWRYQAANVAEQKSTHLFNFFEAAALFLGTIMASAFHSNPEFFRKHRQEWFDQGKNNSHTLSRSSFGEWVMRCQRLAKTSRTLLSDKDNRAQVIELYRTDPDKIDGLSNKAIYATLEKVRGYRNNWKGHTGIVSARDHEQRLAQLQEELLRFRESLGGVFEGWWLVRPGTNTYTAGLYLYSAEKLMGSRQIFRQEKLTTTEVMDTDELYCYDSVTQRPLQLLRFVRMVAAPDTEDIACYFFSKVEKKSIRWVSYHFEKEGARDMPDPALLKLISEAEDEGT
jgi:hypothetical protein